MLIQACPNGPHTAESHPALPVSVTDIVAEAVRAVAAGATELHIHPKDEDGRDSLRPQHVDPLVAAIRAALPGVPIGVTTGAWATRHAAERVSLVQAWSELPDYASVNWHEDGAPDLADLLIERGIGVEAGIWYAPTARAFASHPRAEDCLRVLIEITEQDLPAALTAAEDIVSLMAPVGVPLLLHGEGANTWPVFDVAVRRGLDSRIGLEDTLTLPDGSLAPGNQALVEAAVARAKAPHDPVSPELG